MNQKTMAGKQLQADLVRARLEKGLRDKAITPEFALEQAREHGLIAYARLVERLIERTSGRSKKGSAPTLRVVSGGLTPVEIARRQAAVQAVTQQKAA